MLASGAHPRSRGENSGCWSFCHVDYGSSPLTRGKHSRAYSPPLIAGLIPAHAGKTGDAVTRQTSRRAHPRSRGENKSIHIVRCQDNGSSPLTRGKHLPTHHLTYLARLIPAHAGKTVAHVGKTFDGRAHPRSRGENCDPSDRGYRRRGSSPLTRGKPLVQTSLLATVWAHPRSRGENPAHPYPRCRGPGLIPAHAGKTFPSMRTATLRTAHPRSRGENSTEGVSILASTGSSPLTRGKRTARRYQTR